MSDAPKNVVSPMMPNAALIGSTDGLGHDSKPCRKCGLVKPLTEYYHGGRDSACKPCYNQQSIAWAKANPEKVRAIKKRNWKTRPKRFEEARRWRERNPEKVSRAQKVSYRKNRNHYLTKSGTRQREQVEALHDEYVKDLLLVGSPALTREAIPQSLVELKRAILKNKRIWRNQKTSTTSETNCSTLSSGSNKTPVAQTKSKK